MKTENKTKIELTDTLQEVLFKMSEGNPGALTVCINILKAAPTIDPDNAMEALGPILSLDALGLYGSKIWILFKYVCESELPAMLAVLRGWQFGFISGEQIMHAVNNHGAGLNVQAIYAKVVERLPNFFVKKTSEAVV